jgi:hypothetical protein
VPAFQPGTFIRLALVVQLSFSICSYTAPGGSTNDRFGPTTSFLRQRSI